MPGKRKRYRYLLSHAALWILPPLGVWLLHFRHREMRPMVYLVCLLSLAFYGIILIESWPVR
jgi:hypothetical protein